MNVSRRDLMKLFGVGAVVAPIVGGMPVDHEAVIVTPPEVKLIERPGIVSGFEALRGSFYNQRTLGVTVFVHNPQAGVTGRIEATRCDFPAVITNLTLHPMTGCETQALFEMTSQFVITGPVRIRKV